jgi:hypothetical protein
MVPIAAIPELDTSPITYATPTHIEALGKMRCPMDEIGTFNVALMITVKTITIAALICVTAGNTEVRPDGGLHGLADQVILDKGRKRLGDIKLCHE